MSVRPAVIRQSLDAMRKQASGVEKPLLEAGALVHRKHRMAFRHEGKLLEPIAGQFLMDFSEREKVADQHARAASPSPVRARTKLTSWFARGIALEEDPEHPARRDRRLSSGARDPAGPRRGAHQSGNSLLQPPGFRSRRKALPRKPSKPIRATPSRTSIWATCSTKPAACRKAIQTYKTASATGSHLCRRPLQSRARLRKDPRAPQGPQTLASLHQARYLRPLVGPRPQPDQAHPASRRPEASPLPPQVAAEFYKCSCGESRPRLSVEQGSTRFSPPPFPTPAASSRAQPLFTEAKNLLAPQALPCAPQCPLC